MKKTKSIIGKVSLLCMLLLSMSAANSIAQLLSFPGAEGFGRFATGGRGGSVYHVTNLNDSGTGSFRDAVSDSYRIVVFDVGGVINIGERIVIHHDVTVAGQTAPGGGITIYGNGIALNDDSGNSIIRYIRIRMGKNGDDGKDAVGISANTDYMFDHVSVTWGRDGTFDINGTGIDNVTIQNCIIGQGINNTNHSTGGLMQSGKISILRTLWIDNKTRNPKGRNEQEYINNVIYNWAEAGYILGDTEGVSEANIMGNYFINGPSTASDCFNSATPTFYVYAWQNYWDTNTNGVLDGSLVTDDEYGPVTFVSTPFDYYGVSNLMTPVEAYNNVVNDVGASLVRDEVDNFLINQLTSLGTLGAIINTEDDNGISGNVGTVANGTAPTDTDQDGMPDEWELSSGMDPNVADNNGDNDGDGYTNIEEYINELAGDQDAQNQGTPQPTQVPTAAPTPPTLDPGTTLSIQAEDVYYYDGVFETTNSGYTGTGYVNCTNQAGGYVEWTVYVASSTQATCSFIYANGGSAGRPADVSVNGVVVASDVDFPVTGDWTTWSSVTLTVDLSAGDNVIRLTGTGSEGLANIDRMDITAIGTVTPDPTSVPTATPQTVLLGDVNSGGTIDIVDALLVAQYYVGLNPANFNTAAADTNCDGSIDIVDALLIAQYYVGLITGFC